MLSVTKTTAVPGVDAAVTSRCRKARVFDDVGASVEPPRRSSRRGAAAVSVSPSEPLDVATSKLATFSSAASAASATRVIVRVPFVDLDIAVPGTAASCSVNGMEPRSARGIAAPRGATIAEPPRRRSSASTAMSKSERAAALGCAPEAGDARAELAAEAAGCLGTAATCLLLPSAALLAPSLGSADFMGLAPGAAGPGRREFSGLDVFEASVENTAE